MSAGIEAFKVFNIDPRTNMRNQMKKYMDDNFIEEQKLENLLNSMKAEDAIKEGYAIAIR